MAQVMSNRAKFLMADGTWSDGTTFTMLLLNGTTGQTLTTNFSGALDPDINFVSEVLAIVGEVSGGSYARQTLASVAATEDDTNNRVNLDAANVTFTAVPAGQFVIGAVIYGPGANDAARPVFGVYEITEIPGNGSDITITITDFARMS